MQTALRITAPLLAPAILSGAVLAFTIAVGLFGTPMVLGWSRQILLLTSRIWIASQAVPPDYGVMAVLSLYLIALSILATAAQRSVLARRSYVTVTGKGCPRPIDPGRLSALTFTIATVYVILVIAAPVLRCAPRRSRLHGPDSTASTTCELRSIRRCLGHHENERADLDCGRDIGNRAGARRLLGGIAHPPPGRRLLEYVVLLPISVPGLAFGVGVMLVWIDVPFAVYGTALIVMLAFIGLHRLRGALRSGSLVQLHRA